MKRTDILNLLAETFNLNKYLEIGVQRRQSNFNNIICSVKTCVDPDPNAAATYIETSDDFFNHNCMNYDLIFIDGLHECAQVKRDFENALECLSDGGFIMLHDTCPHDEKLTTVPRETKMWYGDVYKFAMILHTHPGISFMTINTDYGCTIVWKNEKFNPKEKKFSEACVELMNSMTWQHYENNKRFLNVVEAENIMQLQKLLPAL